LLWLLGPVESVLARTATAAHEVAVEDVATALIRFSSGASGVIEATTAAFPGFAERIEVSGTRGSVVLEAGEIIAWRLADELGDPGPYGVVTRLAASSTDAPTKSHDGHAAQLRDVLDAIEHDREPAVTGEDGRRALEVVLATYESARTAAEVRLPLTRDRAGERR
jgi:predicted dehydrogenase